jgi:electron transfer flavoprotein beta subunit
VEIAVLLKQVPATESMILLAEDGMSIKTADLKWVINPYDEYAVEEALRIREVQGGSVTVYSVGTDKTVEAIRTALAMGADAGVLIKDPVTAACDGLGIAKILAAAVKPGAYDLIIAGHRAVDDDMNLVGPAVAEYLGIPHISMVIRQEITDGRIRCLRTVEGGTLLIEAPLPMLFTTQRGLNEPRYASLPGIMKAKKKPLALRSLADIGLAPEAVATPLMKVRAMRLPAPRRAGRIIQGETDREKAAALVKALHEEARVV